jgi:hypothetical protein
MTSIVFPPGKFICYLRQPKSASLSMTKWMVEFAKLNQRPYLTSLNYQQSNFNVDVEQDTIITHHMTAARAKEAFPQWWDRMEIMVTVRNPWNILASKFYHMRKLGVTQVPTDTFDSFCKGLLDLRGTLNPGKDYYTLDGVIVATHILPVENLQNELARVFNGYQLPELPFVNTGTQSQDTYKELYKDWIHEQIARDFSYEIERFGYEF